MRVLLEKIFLVVALAFLMPQLSFAQAQKSHAQADTLQTIADTLSSKTFRIKSATITAETKTLATPRQKMAGETLQALSTTTVADALKYFSGVQIKDYGGLGGQKTINVRSLGTQHTGVFIDGIRITNCQNGTVDLGKYSLVNMESVELFNANKIAPLMTASEYASASTVYLKTKRPEATSLRSQYSYGSFNTHKAQIHASWKSNFFADVEYDHSDGDYPFSYKSEYEDTTGIRRNSDITFFRGEAGWFTKHLSTHIYLYSSDRGLPGGIVKRLSDQFGDIGREQDINTFAQASYTNNWGNHALKVNCRYAYDFLHANTDFPENQFVKYNNKYNQQDLYLAGAYSFIHNSFTISFSPDIRLSDLGCNVYGMRYVARCDYKAVADVRYQNNRIDLDASLLYTNVNDFSSMATAERLQRLTPSLFASCKITDGLTARTFFKTIFRAPTLNDLYYTHVGRRDLKPEYTKQIDFGLAYSHHSLEAQLDYYHNSVTDKIICVPNGGAYDWKMLNRGHVVTNGIDLSTRFTHKWFSIFVSGTWQDVRDLTDKEDGSYNHQLLYSPKWSFSTVISAFWKGITASVSHLYCSDRYWTYASDEDILPQYNCTDAKIQYTFRNLTLSAECNDIFDKHYELIQRWPLPGRRFTISVVYSLNIKPNMKNFDIASKRFISNIFHRKSEYREFLIV